MKRKLPDPVASLAASLLVATSAVALVEAHRVFQQRHDVEKAKVAFLTLLTGARKVCDLP